MLDGRGAHCLFAVTELSFAILVKTWKLPRSLSLQNVMWGIWEFPLSWQLVPLSVIHTQTQMHMCRLIGWFVCVCVWFEAPSRNSHSDCLRPSVEEKQTLTQRETIIFAHTASERTSTLVLSRQKEKIPCCNLTKTEFVCSITFRPCALLSPKEGQVHLNMNPPKWLSMCTGIYESILKLWWLAV